jgi:MYXO-CTERM domain-containing protein
MIPPRPAPPIPSPPDDIVDGPVRFRVSTDGPPRNAAAPLAALLIGLWRQRRDEQQADAQQPREPTR